jgi:hypothetical protein
MLLLALLLHATPLAAEEPVADPEAVGRQLLASDPAEQARGEAALLEALERVTDRRGYVRKMAAALRGWANAEARLVEAWVERAVNGDSEEQERATLMLTALGEPAVSRLAHELRRARAGLPGAPAAPAAAPAPAPEPLPGPVLPADPGRAQIYDVADLLGAGSDGLTLLSLAKRSADTPQVALVSTRLVVTANDEGHARLALALQQLRPQGGPPAEEQTAVETAEPAAPKPALPATPPAWALKVWAVSVVAREVEGLLEKAGAGTPLDVTRAADGALTATGPAEWAAAWAQRALRSADAEPLAETLLDVWNDVPRDAHLGRVLTYRREARPGQGGAWVVSTATLETGLALRASVSSGRLELGASWTSVTLPLPTSTVSPAPGVAPVELDRPDWTAARRRASLPVPPQGAAALLSLPDLLPAADRRLVLVLSLEPR